MSDKVSVVAVLPSGTEHFDEVVPSRTAFQDVACDAARRAGIAASRNDPQDIKVRVYKLEIYKGKLERRLIGDYKITPPRAKMTESEYTDDMTLLLAQLPEEFRPYVTSKSWDAGHSSGYEEVLSIAENMVTFLKPAIEKYTLRVKGERS